MNKYTYDGFFFMRETQVENDASISRRLRNVRIASTDNRARHYKKYSPKNTIAFVYAGGRLLVDSTDFFGASIVKCQ